MPKLVERRKLEGSRASIVRPAAFFNRVSEWKAGLVKKNGLTIAFSHARYVEHLVLKLIIHSLGQFFSRLSRLCGNLLTFAFNRLVLVQTLTGFPHPHRVGRFARQQRPACDL